MLARRLIGKLNFQALFRPPPEIRPDLGGKMKWILGRVPRPGGYLGYLIGIPKMEEAARLFLAVRRAKCGFELIFLILERPFRPSFHPKAFHNAQCQVGEHMFPRPNCRFAGRESLAPK